MKAAQKLRLPPMNLRAFSLFNPKPNRNPNPGRAVSPRPPLSLALAIATACLFLLVPGRALADEEQDLLATLRSDASVPAKCTACVRLRIVGTTNSIPALAALLADEHTSQAARDALEGMPFPEALAALRQSLGTVSGPLKAGVIDSLGWRHDAASVSELPPLLSDTDPTIATPYGITVGSDGALWFANYGNNSIGRITRSGVVTKFTDPGIVNPYSIEEMADAIATALAMPLEERTRRMKAMQKQVASHTAFHWATDILFELLRVRQARLPRRTA